MASLSVQRPDGRQLAQFAILPTRVDDDTAVSAFWSFRKLAGHGGKFFFLVTPETVRGWRLPAPKGKHPGAPDFRKPASSLLSPYATPGGTVADAAEQYLTELVRAWLADLRTHWQSRNTAAPGEKELKKLGLVQLLHEAQGTPE